MRICTHTRMRTQTITYMHTYLKTYIPTYLSTCPPTCMHAYIHTCTQVAYTTRCAKTERIAECRREDKNVLHQRSFSNRLTLAGVGCIAGEGTTCMVSRGFLCDGLMELRLPLGLRYSVLACSVRGLKEFLVCVGGGQRQGDNYDFDVFQSWAAESPWGLVVVQRGGFRNFLGILATTTQKTLRLKP